MRGASGREIWPRFRGAITLATAPAQSDGSGTCAPNLGFQEPFCGNTAMHVAAKDGHTEVVIRLLEAGAPAATAGAWAPGNVL